MAAEAENLETPVSADQDDLDQLRKTISQIPDIAKGLNDIKAILETHTTEIEGLKKTKKQEEEEEEEEKQEEEEEDKKPKDKDEDKAKKAEDNVILDKIIAMEKKFDELTKKEKVEPEVTVPVVKSEPITKVVDPVAPPAVASAGAQAAGQGPIDYLGEAIERSNNLNGDENNLIEEYTADEQVKFFKSRLANAEEAARNRESMKKLPGIVVDAPAVPVWRRGA